jgi:exodeoxyribonuclease VII large subunit
LAVPDGADLRRRLLSLRRAMVAHASEGVRHARTVVDFHRRSGLAREPRRILAQCAQQVDGLAESLRRAADDRLRLQKERLERLGHRLAAQRPGHVLAQRAQMLTHLATRLSAAQAYQRQAAEARIQRAADMLRSLGPQAVLSRGYTMTLAPNGQALTRATQVRPGDRLTTRLADGTIESLVTTPRLPPAGGPPAARPGRPSRPSRPPR